MKIINLIPYEIKKQRENSRNKKIGLILSIIPITLLVQMNVNVLNLEKKMEETREQITEVQKIQSNIYLEEDKFINYTQIKEIISKETLPLHQFLYFIIAELPEDIQLYGVVSKSMLEENKQIKKEMDKPKSEKSEQTQNATSKNSIPEIVVSESEKIIVIRGAALTVGSIGELTKKLKELSYVKSVDLGNIENYYNVFYNYKIFEITVELN